MSNRKKIKNKNVAKSGRLNLKEEIVNPLYIIAPVFILGIIPLLLGLHIYDCGYEIFPFFPDSNATQYDFYLYAKLIGVYVALFIIAAVFLWSFLSKQQIKKIPKTFILLGAAAILALLSALFGGHTKYAFLGSYDMFVTVIAVIGYLAICLYFYLFIDSEKMIEYIARIGGVFVGVLLVIGVFQAFGADFFQTVSGIRVLAGPFHQEYVSMISNTPDIMNITLSHGDNVSGYLAIMIPLTVSMIFFFREKKRKIIAGIFFVCEIIIAVGIDTASVKIASVLTIVIAAVIFLYQKRKIFYGVVCAFAALLIAGVILVMTVPSLKQLMSDTFIYPLASEDGTVASIYTGDEEFTFVMKDGSELIVTYTLPEGAELSEETYTRGTVSITDGEGNAAGYGVETSYDEENGVIMTVAVDNHTWDVVYGTDGTYWYRTAALKLTKITEDVEKANIFPAGFFTMRGQIWNRALPRILKHIIIGAGANCFGWDCSQTDYVFDKYNGMELLYDVKAHNYYINTAIEEGALGFGCIMVFLLIYLISSIKIYWEFSLKRLKNDRLFAVGCACMIACIWYLINGFANDSYIGIAPIFWGMTGMGMAINHRIKYNIENND